MKNRLRRWMILMGMICIMGLGACGCGKTEEPVEPAVEEPEDLSDDTEEEEPEEPSPEDDTLKDEEIPSGGARERRTDTEDLTGDILEIGDMQFTVTEIITEEMEDGGTVMASLASGADDSNFAKVTVTYDENTLFYIRTIYDNGARHEDSDGSAEDLKEEMLVLVWGTYEGNGEKIHAEQIQMEQFVR